MEKEQRTPIRELPYSAGLMSQSCWFVEFKKIIQLVADGKSQEEIRIQCLENNLLGAAKEYRAKRVYGYLISRAKMLDAAGFPDCKICASNSLDEYIIADMLRQGAPIDTFGVGERLITASSEPVFGGVYKVVSINKDGVEIPKIKISENVAKITNPCFKELYRLYDNESGKAIADVITLFDEVIDDTKPYVIFDPEHTWKRKTITNFKAVKIRKRIFDKGELCYEMPEIDAIKNRCKEQLETLWDEVKRFENPHTYYVDLSEKLWECKQALLRKEN